MKEDIEYYEHFFDFLLNLANATRCMSHEIEMRHRLAHTVRVHKILLNYIKRRFW